MHRHLVNRPRAVHWPVLLTVALVAGLLTATAGTWSTPAEAIHEGLGTQVIRNFAGTGEEGFSGDGGQATEARLNDPTGAAVDSKNNVYIADIRNHSIRKVATDGTISTVAGTGDSGFSGDGGPATDAQLSFPSRVAVDANDDVYISDFLNNRIRKIDTSAGTINTVTGSGATGFGGAGFSGDGGPATDAQLFFPNDVHVNPDGSFYIADAFNERVRYVDTNGIIDTVAGTGNAGYSGDGGQATNADFDHPWDITTHSGNLYIADNGNNVVRKVNADGVVSTVAGRGGLSGYSGDGGPATEAELFAPTAVVVDDGGNLYISDSGNGVIRKVDTDGTITTFAGGGDSTGDLGVGVALTQASLAPYGLTLDDDYGMLVADRFNNRIRQITRIPDLVAVSSLTASQNPGRVGDELTYTAQVENPGLAGDASGVQLTMPLQDADFVPDGSSEGCSETDGTVTCTVGSLAEGATTTVEIAVTPTAPVILEHTATVAVDGEDPYPSNNTASTSTVVADEGCGKQITEDTTLSEDIGPCPGNGLEVAADGVTVDLNGHSVIGFRGYEGFGFPEYDPVFEFDGRNAAFGLLGLGNEAGVLVADHHDVTVQGGTVTGFSGGVVLTQGASGNTVQNLKLVDNVGPKPKPGGPFPPLGDGILAFNSPDNVIADNEVVQSGWYDGIGLWRPGSDNNEVTGNTVDTTPAAGDTELAIGIVTNGADMHQGKIRGTTIASNTVRNAGAHGISNVNSFDARISNNLVVNSGLRGSAGGRGIAVSAGDQLTTASTNVTVVGNTVRNSDLDGIHIRTRGNKIINNDVDGSGQFGDGSRAGEDWFDLHDLTSETCEFNTWNNNKWGSAGYFPECTSNTGMGKGKNPAAGADPSTAEGPEPMVRQPPEFANNDGG